MRQMRIKDAGNQRFINSLFLVPFQSSHISCINVRLEPISSLARFSQRIFKYVIHQ